jgi:DinB superfamily
MSIYEDLARRGDDEPKGVDLRKHKGENIMSSNALDLPASVSGQTLTSSERDLAHLYLKQTHAGVTGAIRDLCAAQWSFKPSPDEWSIAENVDHIIFVLERVLGPIRDQLATAAAASSDYDYRHVDDIVINRFPNRLLKVRSPHQPAGDLSPSDALDRVFINYARLSEYLDSAPDLRQHAVDSAPLKAVTNGAYDRMDGYQWILAAAAHTERHTKQILEIRANADFPQPEERLHLYDEWPRR